MDSSLIFWSEKANISGNIACWKCQGNVREGVHRQGRICHEVETVREITYVGGSVSVGGVCEPVVIVITGYQ